jgi:hypothetical protein
MAALGLVQPYFERIRHPLSDFTLHGEYVC